MMIEENTYKALRLNVGLGAKGKRIKVKINKDTNSTYAGKTGVVIRQKNAMLNKFKTPINAFYVCIVFKTGKFAGQKLWFSNNEIMEVPNGTELTGTL